MSKVDIARKIRDNGYIFKCSDFKDGICQRGGCIAYSFCNGLINANDNTCEACNIAVDAYIKRYSRKPTTDTFTESKFNNEPKKVEPKTLTAHIIKLKSDCVVLTEDEFNRLKKIEEDYILIKKVLED